MFSTTTSCFRLRDMASPTSRATVSVGPPALPGTTRVIVLSGNARAADASAYTMAIRMSDLTASVRMNNSLNAASGSAGRIICPPDRHRLYGLERKDWERCVSVLYFASATLSRLYPSAPEILERQIGRSEALSVDHFRRIS